jgi:hypothetical protein
MSESNRAGLSEACAKLRGMTEPRLLRRPYQASMVGGRVLILGPSPTRPTLVARETAAAFAQCVGPRPLAEHLQVVRAALNAPEDVLPRLTSGLQEMWKHGFFTAWPVQDSGEPTNARLTTVAILTRNRPDTLARCLRSHLDHADRSGRTFDIAVVDSSDGEDFRRANRDMLRAAAGARHTRFLYCDVPSKQSYAERLAARAGLDPEIARFALTDFLGLGQDAGANRNALLLGLAGQAFLSSDDDVVCESRRPALAATSSPRLRLTSRADPTDVHLFDSLDAALASVPPDETDLFGAHERLLGNRLTSLLHEMPFETMAIDEVGPSFWDLIAAGRGHLAVTSSGLLGDSGSRYPAFYAWSKTTVKQQLLTADEAAYRSLLESRQLLRAADCPTVTRGPFIMSTHVGLDARRLLPPFSPVFRGQDMVFAALLRQGLGDALVGHVPRAVLHVPGEPRRASLDALWRPSGAAAFATVLTAAINLVGQPVSAGFGAGRLRALGRGLRDLAGQEPTEAAFLLRTQIAETSAMALSRLAAEYAALKADQRPWVRDLRRQFDDRLAELLGSFSAGASEIADTRPNTAELETLDLIGRFGALLEAWPGLFEAAVTLVERGEGPFSPL